MVREEPFVLLSNDKKTNLCGMSWIPEGEVAAVVQLCHGMSEYVERYREFATYLAERGIFVTGHDHLGHGGSVRSKEDYGFFAEENGNRVLLRDIHSVYRRTKSRYPDVPYVMFGHSMGSFLVRQYLCCFGDGLDAAVICGTGFQPAAVAKTGMALSRLEAALLGWRHRSRLLWWMSFGGFNLRFRPNRTKADWLCSREETVDAYLSDPKCGIPFTLNGYYNLFLGLLKIESPEYLDRMPRSLPVLMIAGDEDPVGDFGKGVRKVADRFREIGMEQVECRLYPGDHHEILNEDDREKVFADVYGWIKALP